MTLRIAVAAHNPSVVGGTESYLRRAIVALQERNHTVGVLHELRHAPAHPPIAHRGAVPHWCVSDLGDAGSLAALREWRPDVVFAHGLADPALEAALLSEFRCVLFAHGYYGTCISGAKLWSTAPPRSCTRRFGLSCLALYLPCRCGGRSPFTAAADYARQRARNQGLGRYAAIAVASEHMRAEFARHGVAADCLHVLGLLPDVAPDPVPPIDRAPGDHVIMVGRFTAEKGGDYLVHAVPRASAALGRPLRITFVGEGIALPRWRALAATVGVQADEAGWLETPARTALMRAADLLVAPSVWPEPFGLVGIEAFAVGLPAVGFASGGIPEWLRPGETGELAPTDPPTADALAEAIVRALGDPLHYKTLRRGAWAFAVALAQRDHVGALERVLATAAA